ncbi:MAG: PEP-CTERM sorting domain-containing protein [Colwellia sp.]
MYNRTNWTTTIVTRAINIDQPDTPVPEPSTLAIFALGMMGLASRRFKK